MSGGCAIWKGFGLAADIQRAAIKRVLCKNACCNYRASEHLHTGRVQCCQTCQLAYQNLLRRVCTINRVKLDWSLLKGHWHFHLVSTFLGNNIGFNSHIDWSFDLLVSISVQSLFSNLFYPTLYMYFFHSTLPTLYPTAYTLYSNDITEYLIVQDDMQVLKLYECVIDCSEFIVATILIGIAISQKMMLMVADKHFFKRWASILNARSISLLINHLSAETAQ